MAKNEKVKEYRLCAHAFRLIEARIQGGFKHNRTEITYSTADRLQTVTVQLFLIWKTDVFVEYQFSFSTFSKDALEVDDDDFAIPNTDIRVEIRLTAYASNCVSTRPNMFSQYCQYFYFHRPADYIHSWSKFISKYPHGSHKTSTTAHSLAMNRLFTLIHATVDADKLLSLLSTVCTKSCRFCIVCHIFLMN